jgi:hypothetical protein
MRGSTLMTLRHTCREESIGPFSIEANLKANVLEMRRVKLEGLRWRR